MISSTQDYDVLLLYQRRGILYFHFACIIHVAAMLFVVYRVKINNDLFVTNMMFCI